MSDRSWQACESKTQTRYKYPCCDDWFDVDHLGSDWRKVTWSCGNCGTWYDIEIGGWRVTCRPTGEVTERPWLLLSIEPRTEPIWVIVPGWREVRDGKPDDADEVERHNRYHCEEHTCPTNTLRDVHEVGVVDDRGPCWDPHELFTFHGVYETDWEAKEAAEAAVGIGR